MLSKLFGTQASKEADQADSEQDAPQYAPGTEISYDSKLITRFKGHHVSLLKLFTSIKQRAEAGDFAQTLETIETFKNVLQQHLLEENIRFYTYLKMCLQKDEENSRLMNSMKSEMEGIGRVVTRFISHYLEFGIDEGNVKKFLTELQAIGAALQDRIAREENSLYTLYHAPAAY
jgi:hypothetical protein